MEEKTIQNSTALTVEDKKYSQYLTFTLGSDVYGIPVNIIREVDRYSRVFPVPKSPVCIKGIINLRGDVIPVIDLNIRLFGTGSRITALTNIIIVEFEQESEISQIGIINDCVKAVVDIADEDIETSPGFSLNVRKDFITGIGKLQDNFVILLDIQSVLNVNEISHLLPDAERTNIASVLPTNVSGDIKHGE